jgi:2-C-methyl-D-erythritol 4-phosphate cytidylyltransferase / 2-C-methyl-D-erythritol 2,4-cyclodiphosphate synthase
VSVWAVLVAAGSGERLGLGIPKALVPLHGGDPLFLSSVPALREACDGVIVVVPEGQRDEFERWLPQDAAKGSQILYVDGGSTRQASVAEGLSLLPDDAETVLVHDAARPFLSAAVVRALLDGLKDHEAMIPAAAITDTVKKIAGGKVSGTVPRQELVTVETPQAFKASVLRAAHAISRTGDATDDAALVEAAGGDIGVLMLPERGLKVTTPADLQLARERFSMVASTGVGTDSHRLVEGRPLMLGCVRIEHPLGPEGHSDGDAVAHAICDAMFGAARLGDLGDHFPVGDDRWKDSSGEELLRRAREIVEERAGLKVDWVDATIIIQTPAMRPHRDAMRAAIARSLGIEAWQVSIKATTTDGLGLIGEGEGVAANATVGLIR